MKYKSDMNNLNNNLTSQIEKSQEKSKLSKNNKCKVKYQKVIYVESMKCPSAKKRGSVKMQCNLIQAYIIPVL